MNALNSRKQTPQDKASILPRRQQQLSIKITDEACERFRRHARVQGLTLGALFEQALDAWEVQARWEARSNQER